MNPSIFRERKPGGRKTFDLEAVVLAGGLGTRLKSVLADTPKILAPLGGRPLLDTFIDKLLEGGAARIILCVGYLRDQIIEYVRRRAQEDGRYRLIEFSKEQWPLGTGGALKNAASLVKKKTFFIMNGDTLHEIDIAALRLFHLKTNGAITIAVHVSNREDVGRMRVDASARILGFEEKSADKNLPVSTGVYMMNKDVLAKMPSGPFSLEYDFFPTFVQKFPCYAFFSEGDVIDIGTPERYHSAKKRYTQN